MCYSAKVWQKIKEYMRYRGVVLRLDQYELLFQRRLTDSSIRIPRGFEDNFLKPNTPQERRIRALIDEHRSKVATQWEQELFKQRKRLADAQRSLTTEAMARGDMLIYGGRISAGDLLGDADVSIHFHDLAAPMASTILPRTWPRARRSCAAAACSSGYAAAIGTWSFEAWMAWLSRSNSRRPGSAS